MLSSTNGHFILSRKKQSLLFWQTLKHRNFLPWCVLCKFPGLVLQSMLDLGYCYNYAVLDKVQVKISTWSTQESGIDTKHTHAHGKFIQPYIDSQWI